MMVQAGYDRDQIAIVRAAADDMVALLERIEGSMDCKVGLAMSAMSLALATYASLHIEAESVEEMWLVAGFLHRAAKTALQERVDPPRKAAVASHGKPEGNA